MNDNKRSPFEGGVNLNISPEEEILKAMKECSRIAAENDISNMTLEEINEEIGKVKVQIRTRASNKIGDKRKNSKM